IPSRYESSRFPGKALIDIAGKTMIQRVYEGASKSSLINDVVVATDDQRIADEVKRFGGKQMLTSTDHGSGTERCGEVIKSMTDYDVILNIQGDEPLIESDQLDQLIEVFNNSEAQIGTIVKSISQLEDIRNPNRIKVVLDGQKNGIYFSRSPIPNLANVLHEEWLNKSTFYKHIGIYAWRTAILEELLNLEPTELEMQESLEQLRWIYHGYKIRTVETQIETPNIDVPEDLNKVLEELARKA
ncbi:3-deoxy-manno-octulosonate cytidylyltransferase, partial [Crocinitomix catalasitica]|nr:3-deoxy-manno-octulosonate cytidylyltransferase [Crocinitomix catalasitica]